MIKNLKSLRIKCLIFGFLEQYLVRKLVLIILSKLCSALLNYTTILLNKQFKLHKLKMMI